MERDGGSNDFNADYPLEFYKFFKEIGSHYIQFAPIVERIMPHQDGRHLASLTDKEKATELADFSVSPEQWGNFLCTLFDEWVKQDVGTYYISSSTPPLPTGWANSRAYAPWQRPADMPV